MKTIGNMSQTKPKPEGKLQHVNLKNVRFHSSDKAGTNVDNYENLQKLDFVHCEFNDGHKLYEDANFHTFPEEQRAGILKRLEYNYRYLRKHYDEKGDYIEGNDFHYNYMEAKRKTSGILDCALLYIYGLFNGYNTKIGRTINWLLFVLFFSTIVYYCGGDLYQKDAAGDKYISVTNAEKLNASCVLALSNIILIPKTDMIIAQDINSIRFAMFENTFGTLFTVLLGFSLRNRFRRSKSDDEFK